MGTNDPPPDSTNSLPPWLSDKRVQIAWIVVYFLQAIMCFCIFVPIVMSKDDSDGQCILYADLSSFGRMSVCDYCISVTVLFLIMCTVRAVFDIVRLTGCSSKLSTLKFGLHVKGIFLLVDMIMLLLLLVVACLISAGFAHLCNELFHDSSECDSKYGIGLYPSGNVNYTYYSHLSVAQGAAWFTFCVWFLAILMKALIFWKDGSLKESTVKAKAVFGKSNPGV